MNRPRYEDEELKSIQRKVDPFTMYPTTALRFAKSFIQSNEEKLMEQFLRDTYNMDKAQYIDLDLSFLDVHVSPVYYPAYVFTVNYLGRKLRTFVNGHDLAVSGIRIYNWRRVAIVSALGMSVVMTLNGGIGMGGISGSFWVIKRKNNIIYSI